MKRTFVIGDVHGHYTRLMQLLVKIGKVTSPGQSELVSSVDPDIEVVQVGDLGNFGKVGWKDDYHCYQLAALGAIDVVLWGNHDRAVADPYKHGFRGFDAPGSTMQELMLRVRPRLAYAAHGYLITHAGLHPMYATSEMLGRSAEEIAEILNAADGNVVDAIGAPRGGWMPAGGILWRDAEREDLWVGVPQIFGHTRGDIRMYGNRSVCVDVGSHNDGNLAGIWLPERKVVAVGPDADIFEKQIDE